MKLPPPLRAVAAASLVVGLVVASGATAGALTEGHATHALFLETDNSAGNRVLSYWRSSDGTISYAGSYPTGGRGATAAGATADPLASQGGLTLINNDTELVATNPGSDTVSVFSVQGTRLALVQQIASGGLFPNSVTTHGDLVAVLNAGGEGTVAEFRLVNGQLIALPGQVRSLELGSANTNPPYYLDGAGQVGYTPNGQHLIVTTKDTTNSYEVFSVAFDGALGTTAVVTTADNAVPFAFDFDGAGNLVAAEASNSSVSTYQVNANGSLKSLGTVSETGAALCWISSSDGYYFGDNAGSGTVSSFTEQASGTPELVNATAATAQPGLTDSAVSPDGNFLYAESGGSGTVDVYGIGSGGTLTPIETIFNIPVASEGIAVS